MDLTNILGKVTRYVVAILGGAVAGGFLDQTTATAIGANWEQIVGGVVALVPMLYSIFVKGPEEVKK